ncbi:MAG: hypothetical protein IRY88_12360, partial [Rubrobacteraceae bacterium]|nr:hypothetical protein [Rubrobacteraceae bacterium]
RFGRTVLCFISPGEGGWGVGVCGEAASDPDLIPTLVGLGVSELSMSPPSIPRAKKVISELP